MPYQVKKYDGTELVTIPDYQYNDTSTTVVLFGKGVTNYGQPMAENLVHLMENFAGPTSPGLPSRLGEPLVGQLWYDTMNRKLRVRSPTANWDVVGAANVGASPPTPPNAGDFWLDTSTDPAKLRIFNGTTWQLVGSSAAVGSTDPVAGTSLYETGTLETNNGTYFTSTTLGNNAAPEVGDLWWDYTTRQFKIYDGANGWTWQGPMMDHDHDTFISPEGLHTDTNGNITLSSNPTNPKCDDDVLHFVCAGKEQVKITVGSLRVPVGPTTERPGDTGNTAVAVEAGMIRYNTTLHTFEGRNDLGSWGSLGGVIDVDQDTYVTAEKNPESPYPNDPTYDNDVISVYNRGDKSADFIPSGDLILYSKGFMQIPVGTTSQRPPFNVDAEGPGLPGRIDPDGTIERTYGQVAASDGMMRYNTTRDAFEIRIQGSWVGFKNPKPGAEDVFYSSSYRKFFGTPDALQVVATGAGVRQINLTAPMAAVGITTNMIVVPVVHNLGNPYVIVQVYDDFRKMVIPDEVFLVDETTAYLEITSFYQAGANPLSIAGPGPDLNDTTAQTTFDSNWGWNSGLDNTTINGIVTNNKKWCVVCSV